MIPRFRPHFSFAEWAAALAFWRRNSVADFEAKFAKKFGQKFGVAFPHGRTGLLATLDALRIRNMHIICPSYTCVVVAHAIKYSGNEPLFLDSRAFDFNMDFGKALADSPGNVGAIVATSIFGHPVDLGELERARNKFPQAAVIQDCCHSYNCSWNGREVQSDCNASFFALNISKIINSIFGGMVLTDDEELYRRLLAFRAEKLREPSLARSFYFFFYLIASTIAFTDLVFGFTEWLSRKGFLSHFIKYYDESKVDMPKDYLVRMSPLQARVGLVQLDKFDSIVKTRRMCAELYERHLRKFEFLELPPMVKGATYSHYVVRTNQASSIRDFFRENGVQLGEIIEYNVGDMTPYRGSPYGDYPVARAFVGRTLNLPLGKLADAERTIHLFRKYENEAKRA